ncbi:adhesin isopeptide-forming adherence domain protein, partial [Bifidobacterium saguini DSM 23967]
MDVLQFWQYKDDATGSWGPADSLDSVRAAMKSAGVTLKGDGVTKATKALEQARTECEDGFKTRHPGEGDGECRVVAVGAVPYIDGDKFYYDGSGYYDPNLRGSWFDNWNNYVATGSYQYGNVTYKTSYPFDDDPQNSVDKIMKDNVTATSKPSIVIIVLDKYQPAPPETPPNAPTKTVQKGTSADSMANETVITTGTGVGGKKMTISDTINPNGMKYTVTGQKVIDKTDGNKDVSGQFTFNTADGQQAPNDVATATWNGGDLPEKHEYEYHLTITVTAPVTSKVVDTPSVTWNDKGTGDVDSREFPTWEPNPDKSWILYRDGKWQAVVDPDETNATGADGMKFLDGDTVGSAVNGTVDPDLIEAPTKLELADDWSAADYLVDVRAASEIRVYAKQAEPDSTATVDGGTVKHYTKTSVADIANTGEDVTSMFDITVEGTKAVASAKPEYLKTLKGMGKGLQVTMIVPFTVNFANGKGAEQVRKDFGKAAGDELTFCTNPTEGKDHNGPALTNKGSETVNGQTVATNEPKICGWVPKVKKDVLAESSQGGDQSSVDGKTVYPGQKVEYELITQPKLPSDLATIVTSVGFTDNYDEYLAPDKQTVEMRDLATGHTIPKSKYTTKWDDSKHLFQLTVKDKDLIAQWRAGSNPRLLIRFEGTVAENAPTTHKVNNKWVLTLNNGLTPSNEVFNLPPDFQPSKKDTQSAEQGDPTISIDGKTMLLGDTGNYVVTIDATQKDQAYKVWRLGATDDFDEEYVSIDPAKIEVIGSDGKDYTKAFNIQLRDGVVYAYAKTVDTEIPATGETVKGDPQPTDLKAYAEKTDKDYDPLKDPAIDQKLLGRSYQLVMPYKVVKVTDGYVVRNKAVQIVNNVRKETNEVSNPLKPINPKKDVTVKVGGDSIDGKSVYLNHTFLYRLDSSILPADRAYQKITDWTGVDQLDTEHDEYLGNWAVYAQRDLYRDGQLVASKGERIAGTGFDSSKLGELFNVSYDQNGKVSVAATQAYLDLVSADNGHEAGWSLYIQCKRTSTAEKVENKWDETVNGTPRESNIVWTRTPDMTPSIHLEKVDTKTLDKDGQEAADRDDPKQALKMNSDSTSITFIITNTSKTDPETGEGAWFKASDLKLKDNTIVGDAHVDMDSLTYPSGWDALILKPGESVKVTGTLKGVNAGGKHTNRASVTGTPLVECAPSNADPFNGSDDGTDPDYSTGDVTEIDGRKLCSDTQVVSNTDDWNGYRPAPLASTGAGIMAAVVALLL